SIAAEKRLGSSVQARLFPVVIWEFCDGIRGVSQRDLGVRGGDEARKILAAVADSSLRVRRAYGDTPWEAGAKLGFLYTFREGYADFRVRGAAPEDGEGTGNKGAPVTPSEKPPPPGPTTPSDASPGRPDVGTGGS